MNRVEVPEELKYNIVMLDMKEKNKELVVEMKMCGEWFCRGDRGWEEWKKDVNFDKIREVWDSRNDDDFEEDRDDLNNIESWILNGDYGFIWDDDEDYSNSKRGISGCMSRVDELLEGKSILIELEEGLYCIGNDNCKGKYNKVEIDYMNFKIDLLKG